MHPHIVDEIDQMAATYKGHNKMRVLTVVNINQTTEGATAQPVDCRNNINKLTADARNAARNDLAHRMKDDLMLVHV